MRANLSPFGVLIFCLVFQSRLLPNKMSALPGSSLTTHLSLDGITISMFQESTVVQILHFFILATV